MTVSLEFKPDKEAVHYVMNLRTTEEFKNDLFEGYGYVHPLIIIGTCPKQNLHPMTISLEFKSANE